ncbi:pilus assembly protein [Gilvimarinus sp. F26214L]|uniref:pilus assembly protein n=1 Tax=Gilvimarinus sp. DZF01 TaxID=3461371 RepID=UPI0040460250
MKRLILSGLVAFSVWHSLAFADDTDIYLLSRDNSPKPYLMLTFDYRNDMTATFCNGESACRALMSDELFEELQTVVGTDGGFKATNLHALIAVMQEVFDKFHGIYVGLMMANVNNGGTILRGFKEFEEEDTNGAKQELIDILRAIPIPSKGNQYHEVAPKEMHYELWRYLNGAAPDRGIHEGEVPALGFNTSGNFPAGVEAGSPLDLPANQYYYDTSIISNPNDASVANDTYISPFNDPNMDYSCTRLYEVYATSGNAGNKDGNLDSHIRQDMSDGATDGNFDGMLAYMANNDLVNDDLAAGDQTLKTWFIQMGNAATRTDDWAKIMGTYDQVEGIDQYMEVGGKNVDLTDVQAALESFFIEALSVSSTFVSASVPVNVFNRIQTLDNFYIALFEAKSHRRWPGNLKKLRLADTDAQPDGEYDDIVDVNGRSAFSDEDGRLFHEVLTYWTDPGSLPPANPDDLEVENRDGRAVTRGGAGQRIPGYIPGSGTVGATTGANTRQVFVEPSIQPSNGNAESFEALNASDATLASLTGGDATKLAELFGTSSETVAKETIAWARGLDVDDEDEDGIVDEARDWILGDAIHSRPLALNYGATTGYSETNPNIRLFMGTNDGFFHIFEDTTPAGDQSGRELFAFIPRESVPVMGQLRENDSSFPHPYGVDGEPVALVSDVNLNGTIESGDEVYVYVGMRRGGKSYYALEVSNPNTEPKLKWKITKTDNGDFDELGLTFSTPRVSKVQFSDTPRDVLIFAGGYDTNKDTSAKTGADSEGNAIYIVDARTGELIWKAVGGTGIDTNEQFHHAEMTHSIPSTVATLDSNSNGIVDRAYVGDTGGRVWRIDLPEGKAENHRVDNWEVTKLADFSGDTEADDRRFFHPPDIVQTRDNSPYDGVLIASGDRANPLEDEDQNYLMLIKDRATVSGNPAPNALDLDDLPDTTACVTGSEAGCSLLNYSNGWKIKLNPEGNENGEKALASPLTADGQVFFTTYRPDARIEGSCEPLEGLGALYMVNLKNGTAVLDEDGNSLLDGGRSAEIGPGIPPQVTALGDDKLILPGSGIRDPDGDKDSGEKEKLFDTAGKGMYIIYWREPGLDDL